MAYIFDFIDTLYIDLRKVAIDVLFKKMKEKKSF